MYKVLFVDDDENIGFIVSRMKIWKEGNFKITSVAKNGEEALRLLEQENYHLVITDIRMPLVDGLELLQEMRNKGDKTILVLASTYSEFEYAQKGMKLGATDYILKPLTEEGLREVLIRVEEILKEKEEVNPISNEKLDKWTTNIINNRISASEFVEEMFLQLNHIAPNNKSSYSRIIEESMIYIWNNICKAFKWLDKLEKCDFKVVDNLEKDLEGIINKLLAIVNKYKLNKQDSLINKVCDLVVKNIGNKRVIEKVADEVELSKDYVARLFKNKIGITMIEYCTLIKMEYGKMLLRSSNMKVYEISEYLGYTTVDYFTKLFKNYSGDTPIQYKKKLKI